MRQKAIDQVLSHFEGGTDSLHREDYSIIWADSLCFFTAIIAYITEKAHNQGKAFYVDYASAEHTSTGRYTVVVRDTEY